MDEAKRTFDIDVVITWVDGNDPVLNAKRAAYIKPEEAREKDIASPTRYANRGEIYWCVRSVNKFMPWVRRIFLVTDNQDPHVESRIPLEIVDHSVIFRGYEQYLPTFCTSSIEAMLWRIPGLSEHYIYLNDDFMVCRPVTPDMFFPQPGHVLLHARKSSLFWNKLWYSFKYFCGISCRVNHIQRMMNAAAIAGNNSTFIRLAHTPYPLIRSTLEQFYTQHSERLIQNIQNRFRSLQHFRTDEICYIQLLSEGKLHLRPVRPVLMRYYSKKSMMELEWALHRVSKPNSKVCFACFYALDQVSDEIYARISQFAEELLKE
jgi:hypothetical protein